MKQTLLLLFLTFSVYLSAQVTLKLTEPESSKTALSTEDDVTAKGFIKNESDQTITVMWKRNVVQLTDGWDTAVCDKNLCYTPTYGETSEADGTNLVLAAGEESNFDIHVYPNGIEGTAIVELTATDVSNAENTVTGTFTFNQETSTSTSTFSIAKPSIKIYPNPTTNYISLSNEEYVKRLAIYNIVGRRVKLFNANYSNQYNVVDLPTGMYLVRLIGADDRTIKTVRLSKKGGA